jgi:predicted methyltransferase
MHLTQVPSPLPFHAIHETEYTIRRTVYAIEATVHAPTWDGVYGEIFKVLKPGGVVSSAPACK